MSDTSKPSILVRGARQNNLKNLDLDIPLGELVVVTGVSGSGKSSLAFDTVYAEGQRRYVETFSPYARQFLDRMDKPQVDRIDGIPPAIAIDQTNPVRTSRSTVGTMTELNDHLKLLFARGARLYCSGCGKEVRRDSAESVLARLERELGGENVLIVFPVSVPESFSVEEIKELLERQGYRRIHREEPGRLEVIQDRVRIEPGKKARIIESLEAALKGGHGHLLVYPVEGKTPAEHPLRFSSLLHCPDCDLDYQEADPNLFSFNSPVGACETCRGFGRTMGIDYGLVIPDASKSLEEGAVKPFQTPSFKECQDELMDFAARRGIETDVPWGEMSEADRAWVIEGEGPFDDGLWYGAKRFFDWLEGKSYKMHIRVLLSKYRSYDRCPACGGARLKPRALNWRVGSPEEARAACPEGEAPSLPGLNIHEMMLLPIERLQRFFADLQLPPPLDEATELLIREIRARIDYLVEVGLGYLCLDRQSRTLSGGEVQRINLCTALGTSLVGTLFVLDEPSIGLHPRDMNRVVGVLRRLRDAGNSLLVVEHDPQVMLAADRLLDMGPGPGERGGELVFEGAPADLQNAKGSLTADYLCGRKDVLSLDRSETSPPKFERFLRIEGARAHNLKGIDVEIPLGGMVCLTGVSGSGKSTLLQEVLYQGLCKLMGRPTELPGAHKAIQGAGLLGDLVFVDQSPIGKTARSNPVSFVGAWDPIRKLFAEEPLSKVRGYTPGTFSFNAGKGRCPACGGSGFEHVEMQFLSDVYLRCGACDGRRYRSEILEVRLLQPGGERTVNVAEVLEMTVREAIDFFHACPDVRRALEPLDAVGLDYLSLGQPVPTLSGGEAQRLKLAGHLAAASGRKKSALPTLFLFDEPTTGLHFDDIARLLKAFRRLEKQGHSLLIIEHNLDLIRACDWIIDLGPEAGEAGGELVGCGTPEQIKAHPESHTGAALRAYELDLENASGQLAPVLAQVAESQGAYRAPLPEAIEIKNAREHNLRGVDIEIPMNRFTVITGISGSGKSTVAFDILFNEGQRRYLESLNAYARQFVQPAARPEVDSVQNVLPTVAIEQRTSRGGRKSTVGTLTEVHHFLRLLFVKLGTQYCPDCQLPIEPQTEEAILAKLLSDYRRRTVRLLAPLVVSRKGYYTDLATWARGKGFPTLRVDGEDLPTDAWPRLDRFREHDIDLPVGSTRVAAKHEEELRTLLRRTLELGKGNLRIECAGEPDQLASTERACPGCGTSFEPLDPRLFSYNSRQGWCENCFGTGVILPGFDEEQSGEEGEWRHPDAPPVPCPDCEGQRLRPEALAVRFKERSIAQYCALSVEAAEELFREMDLSGREAEIARDVLAELRSRLAFLVEVGLPYLSLDRSAPTLSGGEAQRIRLAAQLGSNLRGVCYILDEPTIGLHPRDNRLLLATLHKLQSKGNTVVVVEHDEDSIRSADHLVDLGPRAGSEGGRVIAQGDLKALMSAPESLTGRFLAEPLRHPLMKRRTAKPKAQLKLKGAFANNLKDVDIALPLGRLICVTGVSGSGKSTLIREVLHKSLDPLLKMKKGQKTPAPHGCEGIEGFESIERILEVDQTPIGKTPRSCPATYVGFWDDIRKLFAATPEAKIRGFGPGRFSFNTADGRCPECLGQGMKKIEMSFLPDVKVDCEVCRGARFTEETCLVRYRDKSIADFLAMSVDEAVEEFAAHRKIHHALKLLQDVGLGYLTLGQQSPTLSGGEAQRLKLVTELARVAPNTGKKPMVRKGSSGQVLYLLDEPTIGLHMADVEKLIRVLHRLVDAGNTVIVIEHNLDVIAEADWIIDMGPEGGDAGGTIVAQGTPEKVVKVKKGSHTAKILGEFLKERKLND